MTLTCNCDHSRTEHLGGSKFYLNDKSILHCLHEKCTCKSYNADVKSKALKQHVILASLTIPSIIIGLCVVALVLSHFAIDFALSDVTMTDKYTYKKFENGKEVNMTSSITGKPYSSTSDLTKDNMFMITFMIVFAGGMAGSMFSAMGYYDHNWRKIVRDEE